MKNNMDKCFTFKQILKFTLPSIIMMMFFSLYTIVDGIFISNYVGTTALGALNITSFILAFYRFLSYKMPFRHFLLLQVSLI